MVTTTVPVPKGREVYKDSDATFILLSDTNPNAKVNCFSCVFITNATTTQADEGKWKSKREKNT